MHSTSNLPHLTPPLFIHSHPERILIVAGRDFAQIKLNRVERFMDAAVVSDIFQNAVDRADDALFASDIFRCAWIAGGILDCDDDGVADFEFAVGGFHRFSQSGRTLGASAVNPSLSISLNCLGSSA